MLKIRNIHVCTHILIYLRNIHNTIMKYENIQISKTKNL